MLSFLSSITLSLWLFLFHVLVLVCIPKDSFWRTLYYYAEAKAKFHNEVHRGARKKKQKSYVVQYEEIIFPNLEPDLDTFSRSSQKM